MLKGTGKQDHLLRIILAREEGMACWRDDCQRPVFCNVCPERMTPSGVPILNLQRTLSPLASQNPPDPAISISATEQVIVGLGNPGAQYANTPHNVGYEVVDQLAIFLGLTWNQMPQAWTARGLSHGQPVCLVKVQMAMNLTGAGLKRLAETMAFSPERCILVFDDLDLPLGIVKTRLGGSAGGHRGVASVLEAFQSDAFRRVKVGVSPIGTPVNRVEFVLRPWRSKPNNPRTSHHGSPNARHRNDHRLA